jgi:hypothetical protein
MVTVQGGADEAVASAMRFYAANGFTPNGNAQLRSTTETGTARYTIVMVAMNRDHSATETNLTIALSSE